MSKLFINLLLLCVCFCTLLRTCLMDIEIPGFDRIKRVADKSFYDDPKFVKAAQKAAGYYSDPRRDPSLKNVLMLVAFNHGYLEFYQNFLCYTNKLGIKLLTVSFDHHLEQHLNSFNTSSYKDAIIYTVPQSGLSTSQADFGSGNFNRIACHKVSIINKYSINLIETT